ncbi:MAG: DUF2283 domain-containing protein [Pirellulales bacterium]
MNIKYFEDTDTALLEFSAAPPVETREISEDIYIDLDGTGALVSMTIEHAASRASLDRVSYERVPGGNGSIAMPH